jgi:hypothetical protein
MAMQPMPPRATALPLAPNSNFIAFSLISTTLWCGGVLELTWQQQLRRWAQDTVGLRSLRASSSSSGSTGSASPELLAALKGHEVRTAGGLGGPEFCYADAPLVCTDGMMGHQLSECSSHLLTSKQAQSAPHSTPSVCGWLLCRSSGGLGWLH